MRDDSRTDTSTEAAEPIAADALRAVFEHSNLFSALSDAALEALARNTGAGDERTAREPGSLAPVDLDVLGADSGDLPDRPEATRLEIVFVDSIPRNPAGKVARQLLLS